MTGRQGGGREEADVSSEVPDPLLDFLSAPSWVATRAVVEAHPALLRPEVEEYVRRLASGARAEGEPGVAAMFEDHAEVLSRTREHGFDRALEGMAVSKSDAGRDEDIGWFLDLVQELFEQPTWVDVLSFVARNPILLGPEADSATDLDDERLSPGQRRSVASVRHLLARAQRVGPLGALLHGALRTGTELPDTLRTVLGRHPELLEEATAEQVVARLRSPAEATVREPAGTAPDPPASDAEANFLTDVLRHCRETDPDTALDAVRDDLAEMAAGEALDLLLTASDPQAMAAVFATWPALAEEEALTALAGRMRRARARRDTATVLALEFRWAFLVRARTAGALAAVTELLEEQRYLQVLTLSAYLYTAPREVRDVLVDGCPILLAWSPEDLADMAERMSARFGPLAAELLGELRERTPDGQGLPPGHVAGEQSWAQALGAARWYTERAGESKRRDSGYRAQATAFCEAALLLAPVDADATQVQAVRLAAAGLCEDEYELGGSVGALHRAIRHREAVLAEPPPGYSRESALDHLRNDLSMRRLADGRQPEEADVAREIEVHREWRDLAPSGSVQHWVRGGNLAELMVLAVRQFERADLIDEALRLYEELLATEPGGAAYTALAVRGADTTALSFQEHACDQVQALLQWKIAHATAPGVAEDALSALEATALRDDSHASWLRLAGGLHCAHELLDADRLAERCDAALREAERRAATPQERCAVLHTRAEAASYHERLTGDGGPLGSALPPAEQALELCRPHSAMYAACTISLAEALMVRFESGGPPQLLDRAVGLLRTLLADGGLSRTSRTAGQGALATALRFLVEHEWDGPLLEEAIEAARAAIRHPGPQTRAYLGTLGTLLRIRFDHTGEVAALDEAVQAHEGALRRTPPGTHFHRGALNNLGNVLLSRARITGAQEDLDAAVHLFRELAETTGRGTGQYARVLTNYGTALTERIQSAEQPGDLTLALTVLDEAVRCTEPTSPHLARRLVNLANGHQLAFVRRGERADIEAAVDTYRRALEALPRDSAFRPTYLGALALALKNRHAKYGVGDFAEAEGIFAEAVREGEVTAPFMVLMAAGLMGRRLGGRGRWPEAAEHLSTGMRAMARLVRTQHRRGHSEAWLGRADGLPAMTAYALARCGRYAQAVRAVEEGRAMLLSRALDREHRDLGALRAAGHTREADHWERLTAELAGLEGADMAGQAPPDAQGHALRTRQLHRELDELDDRIAGLLPPGPREPAGSAVYLVPAPWGGVALLVRPGVEPAALWLDSLRDDTVRAAVIALHGEDTGFDRHQALEAIGGWLWEAALRDVVEELGGLPEVFVCAGLLGLLPLHAARVDGSAGPAGRHLIDLGAVRTAPNLQAWNESRRRAAGRAPAAGTVLAVGAPMAAGTPLPYAAEEARMAAAALAAPGTERVGTAATVGDVARLAPAADVLHLACHGVADLMTPLRGGLVLAHGQVLTLSALLRMRVGARLVVLSACDSGLAGTALPDEAVGLPTGLLQAGASAVVASLWEVPDATALLLMTDFYDRWLADPGGGTAAALAAAQRWLRDTSNGSKRDRYTRWLEEGHPWLPAAVAEACFEAVALLDPQAHDHASPWQWAAFVHVGA